jgi:hypothetical protein
MEQVMMDVGRVTNQELIAQLRNLGGADRTLSARLLVHLGEVDARAARGARLWHGVYAFQAACRAWTEPRSCRIQT